MIFWVTQHVHRVNGTGTEEKTTQEGGWQFSGMQELKVERNVTCPSLRSHHSPCQRAYLRGSDCQDLNGYALCRPFKARNINLLRYFRVFVCYQDMD